MTRKSPSVLLPWALSRLLFFACVLSVSFSKTYDVPAREGSTIHVEAETSFQIAEDRIKKILLSADASWYLEIAQYGYPAETPNKVTPRHWVFFPGYPYTVSLLASITKAPLLSALILSNIFFLLALVCIRNFLSAISFSRRVQAATVYLICFHPFSYFFSTPHSESFFLFVSAAAFLGAVRFRSLGFSIPLSLLLVARPTGVLYLPALLFFRRPQRPPKLLLEVTLACIPLLLFFLHLREKTGSAFAWYLNQEAWGRSMHAHYIDRVSDLFLNLTWIEPWSFEVLHLISLILLLIVTIYFALQKRWGLHLCVFPWLLMIFYVADFWSLSRILMPVFFIPLGIVNLIGSERTMKFIFPAYCFLFGVICLLYALHVSFAMT